MKIFKYGMRLRGFSIGCQPMKGILYREDDMNGRYHAILVYSRELSRKERIEYDLDYLGESDIIDGKDIDFDLDYLDESDKTDWKREVMKCRKTTTHEN